MRVPRIPACLGLLLALLLLLLFALSRCARVKAGACDEDEAPTVAPRAEAKALVTGSVRTSSLLHDLPPCRRPTSDEEDTLCSFWTTFCALASPRPSFALLPSTLLLLLPLLLLRMCECEEDAARSVADREEEEKEEEEKEEDVAEAEEE
mmetsp:Transcript_30005/g.58788  ORF Transcript_30005/g.58788 Transcript_30005/m.58788 type:complete len:150 (-) Transcript_30005:83-532(-)